MSEQIVFFLYTRSFRDENFLPKYNDRALTDEMVRSRIANTSYNPRRRRARSNAADFGSKRDELARHFMYTSSQQASYDDVPWGLFSFLPLSPSSFFFV